MPWRDPPRPVVIVAEALRRVPDPPVVASPPFGPPAAAVASAIARALTPPLAPDPPPGWLQADQRLTFARALVAIRRFGGALIAEAVGTGKTWIALALAQRMGGRAVAIVPSTLRGQWSRAASRAGVPVVIQSHEEWSRRPRALPPGLVVIDESHRFRHTDIRRYVHLAVALVGREGVLLSATPAVNTLADVANQLLLLVRDDALAGAGVPSLAAALDREPVPPQLADLIIAGGRSAGRPVEVSREIVALPVEDHEARLALARLDRLTLANQGAVRELIAGVLASALASSPAAAVAALQRYRALLCQQGDAAGSGVRVGRAALRSILGTDSCQTVLWPLLAGLEGKADLPLSDLGPVDECLAWLRTRPREADGKLHRLRGVLEDGLPSVVFAWARATVEYLRRALPVESRVAWCTGESAGIGRGRLPRRDVLQWFGPDAPPSEYRPSVLITTDVAAEGLDLQYAARVVHYDLPWTAVRLDQRAGRAVRQGGAHRQVEVVCLPPPPVIEARLHTVARLDRKRPIPGRIGLGHAPAPAWRWRSAFIDAWRGHTPVRGAAIIHAERAGAVVGIELTGPAGQVAAFALVRAGHGPWVSDPGLLEEGLEAAVGGEAAPADPRLVVAVLRSVQRLVRASVLGASGGLWRIRALRPPCRAALSRIRRLAAEAARARDTAALSLADRGAGFLRRGHTAGERLLAARLAEAPEDELDGLLSSLPLPDPLPPPIVARVIGVLVLRRAMEGRLSS